MRKLFVVPIALITNIASAQVISGSIVVINLAKDKVVVAADSRGVDNNTKIPDDTYCKISAFGNQFVFTSTGGSRLTVSTPYGNVQSWDNSDLARHSVESVVKVVDSSKMTALTTDWVVSTSDRWIQFCATHREECAGLAAKSNGILTEGIFYRVKDLAIAGGNVTFDSSSNSVQRGIFQADSTKCLACGQTDGSRICTAGEHFDVAEKFCRERKPRRSVEIHTPLRGTISESTKLAVKVVERTIDTYGKTPGDVGGPVDAMTITNGKITWNSLKKNCASN